MTAATLRIGSRTEALVLLPTALLLFILLSLYSLFAYSSTIDQLLDARGQEATRLARRVASAIDTDILPSSQRLRTLAPQAWAVAVVDAGGVPLVFSGELAPSPAPARTESGALGWLIPPASSANVVSATAPLARAGRAARVRVDLPALTLRAKARSLRVVAPFILVAEAGLAVLLLLYLRRLVSSFDRLVATARRATDGSGDEDEVAALVATFERAVEALIRDRSEVAGAAGGDDLAAFQRALARSLESGVLLCDHAGKVLALNEIGASLLAVDVPTASRADLRQVLAPHPALGDLLEDAVLRQRAVQRRECVLDLGDGASRTLGLTVHPLRRDDGDVRGFLAVFADLTAAQRQAEQKRLAANLAEVGVLAAGVAHEMRNGLATLRGYLSLIEMAGDHAAAVDYLSEIRRESDHLERVLEDFLQFARPGSARLEDVDLSRLLARCAADPALDGTSIRFDPPTTAPPTVHADPVLLERALRNLLRNAAQAQASTERTDAIEATLDIVGNRVEIRINDRGPGVPDEIRDRLFEPFTSGRPGGVGLGLALSRRILLLHGGSLDVAEREGGGTSAIVRIPHRTSDGNNVTDGNTPGSGVILPEIPS